MKINTIRNNSVRWRSPKRACAKNGRLKHFYAAAIKWSQRTIRRIE